MQVSIIQGSSKLVVFFLSKHKILLFLQLVLKILIKLIQFISFSLRNYEITMRCLRGVSHCTTNQMYDTLTSGLKYMCVEQRDGFI